MAADKPRHLLQNSLHQSPFYHEKSLFIFKQLKIRDSQIQDLVIHLMKRYLTRIKMIATQCFVGHLEVLYYLQVTFFHALIKVLKQFQIFSSLFQNQEFRKKLPVVCHLQIDKQCFLTFSCKHLHPNYLFQLSF